MSTAVVWFRNDLRLTDNPALAAALRHDRIVPAFILEPAGEWRPGAASRWWLHYSLEALAARLEQCGSRLLLLQGRALDTLQRLLHETGATHIYWNRRYEPAATAADSAAKSALTAGGTEVQTFNASLLFEPWEVRRGDGGPYRVFTAFWRACLQRGLGTNLWPLPARLPPAPRAPAGLALRDLDLLPSRPWDTGLRDTWRPGEAGAMDRLETFLDDGMAAYDRLRDRPDRTGTSRLSPHLHFGEIGPRQIASALAARGDGNPSEEGGAASFVREVGWREFAFHLLFHFPHTVSSPLNPRFDAFPWRTDYEHDLRRWQRGLTGIPLVDAGMRELWHTGWMHNRVRMVVASFLTKNLLIPWREGARWFWDTLVDADLASNTLGWQWVAGSGADAAPYFRIFNPVLQGEKFDPRGDYVRHWVPELAGIGRRHVHKPWAAPAAEQALAAAAGYPPPLADLRESRERALAAYRRI